MSLSRAIGGGSGDGDGFFVSAAAQQHIDKCNARIIAAATACNTYLMYLEYDMLVGEADGGTPLPPAAYKQLQVESRSQRAPAPSTPPLPHTLATGSRGRLLPGQTLRHVAQRLRSRPCCDM